MRKLITILTMLALVLRGCREPGRGEVERQGRQEQVGLPPERPRAEARGAAAEGPGHGPRRQGEGQGQRTRSSRSPRAQYVELAFEGEDQILTLLGEFGDRQPSPTHTHGTLGVINHGGDPGPLHNQIPQPDRLGRQHDDLGARLLAGVLRLAPVRQGAGPLDGQLVPRGVRRALQRRRLRQRLGPGPVQRGRLRQQLLRQHRLHRATSAGSSRTRPTRGGTPLVAAAGQRRGRQRLPVPVRHLGSLRLGRRRQLR